MDTKFDAIKLLNEQKVNWLDKVNYVKRGNYRKIKSNPLMLVIYEILYEEIIIPILQIIKSKIGDNNVRFSGFRSTQSNKEIILRFSNPVKEFSSKLNVQIISESLIEKQKRPMRYISL